MSDQQQTTNVVRFPRRVPDDLTLAIPPGAVTLEFRRHCPEGCECGACKAPITWEDRQAILAAAMCEPPA